MRKDDQELIEPLQKHKFDLIKLKDWMNSVHKSVEEVKYYNFREECLILLFLFKVNKKNMC